MAKKHKAKKQKRTDSKATPVAAPTPGFLHQLTWHSWIIAILAFSIYANTLKHDFTQDDAIVITDNMYTQQGISGIGGLLRYDTFKGFFKVEGKDKLVTGGRYRPLTPIIFALEWQLFEDNAFVYHLTNVVFYVLCCLLLLWTFRELLHREKPVFRNGVSFAAAALFTVHPLHTEAVANVKGADEVVTMLLCLTAFYFVLRAVRTDDFRKMLIAAAVFFFGLMAKENAITFLGIIPVGVYFAFPDKWKKQLPRLMPLLIVFSIFIIIRSWVIGFDPGLESKELLNNPYLKIVGNQFVPFELGERFATIFFTLGKYVQLYLFPNVLTHDYYPRAIEIMQWSDWRSILSLLVYLGIGAFAIFSLKTRNWIGFGFIFFLAAISIVSNLFFSVGTNMSERFMFIPSAGLSLSLAVFLFQILNINAKKANFYLGILILPILLLAWKTIDRNKAWKDNFTLFTTDIHNSPRSAKLQNAVGAELAKYSQTLEDEQAERIQLNTAITHLQEALKIHPNFENAYLQLGNCYTYLDEPKTAIQYYEKVLAMDASDKDAIHNMGVALRDDRQFEPAVQQFMRLYNLGYPKGDVDFKIGYVYEEAGKHYSAQGNQDQAISYFKKGIALSPEKDKLTYFMGVAYALKKDFSNAFTTLQQALQLTKDEKNKVNIYRTLAGMYQETGNLEEAQKYNALVQQAGG